MNGQNKNDNIIPIPNLAERLINKGLERLSQKDFRQAAQLFSQARELEPDNADLNVGLVVSLVELGFYPEARDLCNELLKKGIGDYFQVVNIYLMVLLQLGEHDEMTSVIEALLDDNLVPPDKVEHFEKMLQFSKRVREEKKAQTAKKDEPEQPVNWDELIENKNDTEILLAITKLAEVNVRPYIPHIQKFLVDEHRHPFLKTILLNILKEQEYDKKIKVHKFSRTIDLIPAALGDLSEDSFLVQTGDLAEKNLGQENPTLNDIVQGLIERHYFVFYPLDPSEGEFALWAAAYHALAAEYQGVEPNLDELSALYDADIEDIADIIAYLKEIEEISYPII
ncbi:tetratricopeptide repeat protein [Peribacillus sp. SCS-155]|uniref:tetratricopeptide repeat protein n=1 Tax=Peribacillus sedimenti TaxID=3115297 RepID=UPI0039065952